MHVIRCRKHMNEFNMSGYSDPDVIIDTHRLLY